MVFPNYVAQCKVVSNATFNARYSMEIEIKGSNNQKTAIVFLLNPSSTAKEYVFSPGTILNPLLCNDVDQTTINVLDALCKAEYSKIFLLNLFPYFDSKPRSLEVIYPSATLATNKSYQDNLREIGIVLSANKGSDVFIAWGKDISMNQNLFSKAKIDAIGELVKFGFTKATIKTSKNASFTSVPLTSKQISNAIHGKFF